MSEKHHATEEYSQPGKDRLFVHEFDGIQEYDNPLPGWWKAIFWASAFFAIAYPFIIHDGGSWWLTQSVKAEYSADMKHQRKIVKEYQAKMEAKKSGGALEKLRNDPATLAAGKKIFMQYCVPCHGTKGEGKGIGPNLTDNYWVFGPKLTTLYRVISNGGREGKGMVPWKKVFPAEKIIQLAVFVGSLHGTNPPGAKKHSPDEKYFPPKGKQGTTKRPAPRK